MSDARDRVLPGTPEIYQPGWWRTSAVAWSCVLMFVEGYDMQVMNFAAPAIIEKWHVPRAAFGPVFSINLVGYILGATLLAGLADRMGRKKIIVVSAVLFGGFTVAIAFATTLKVLMILRFLAGIGLGCAIPTVIALAAEQVPTLLRARMISVLFTGYTIGSALGGFIAGRLITEFGWPSLFLLGGWVPLVIAPVLIFALPESASFLVLERAASTSASDVKRSGVPVKELFSEGRSGMTLLLWLAYITSLLCHYLLASWLPTVLVASGVSLAYATSAGGSLLAGGVAGGLLLCWLLDRHGVTSLAVAFGVAAPLIFLIAAAAHGGHFLLIATVFLAGMCLYGGQTALNAVSGTFYPTSVRSTGTGWANGVGRVGSILGPMLGGLLIAYNFSASQLFFSAAIPAVCCAGAVYLFGKTGGARRLAPQATSELAPVPDSTT